MRKPTAAEQKKLSATKSWLVVFVAKEGGSRISTEEGEHAVYEALTAEQAVKKFMDEDGGEGAHYGYKFVAAFPLQDAAMFKVVPQQSYSIEPV